MHCSAMYVKNYFIPYQISDGLEQVEQRRNKKTALRRVPFIVGAVGENYALKETVAF
jgi:hypothetical protein